ncbi:MAG: hydroxyethylthiazole kinase [Pseudolabrys sp.]|nr:hydroxyethylthiazole kinase [Pseudolabrys sp.]
MQHPKAASRDGGSRKDSADATAKDLVRSAAALLARLRAKGPRVHCITNAVAQNFTANALLALGAVPSMTLSGEEVGAFVTRSDALLINLGTFDRERREATTIAIDAATQNGLPWAIDPVLVDRAPQRAAYARDLLVLGPKAMRLNAAEFSALGGGEPTPEAVAAYARERHVVVGLSGQTDWVTDGERVASIGNGDPLMAKVTAMGCAASALVAACLAVEPDGFLATAAALLMVGVAGERAATVAQGPGSFASAILDALYALDEATLVAYAKIEIHR